MTYLGSTSRTRQPSHWAHRTLEAMQPTLYNVIEYAVLGFYLSLLYKQGALDTLLLLVLSACGILVGRAKDYVYKPLALLGTLYVFLAMGTAFLVGWGDGLYRNVQFLLVLLAALGVTKFLSWADKERIERFIRRFTVISFLVFIHIVVYHVMSGKLTTWKYLYDTKTVISICTVLLFLNEDWICRRLGYLVWTLCVSGYAALVLLSGERKAYLLFLMLFIFSRIPLYLKVASGIAGAGLLAVYIVVAPPDDYVARQVESAFKSEHELHISEFYNIRSIADQSDLIREFVNRNAWELFLQNPIMGVGATGYLAWARDTFGTLDESGGLSMNVHGEISRIPAEEGLIGIAVAFTFILVSLSAIMLHFRVRGWSQTPSRQRAPLFVFGFLFFYASFEASDTFMLAMIALYGLEMARSHEDDLRRFAAERRSATPMKRPGKQASA